MKKMAAQLWLDDENSSHSQSSKDDVQDLFVFGYACKVFRNDEKALYVDKGKHLIPWMGDERLMIDRYDGRGHLYDLKSVDADNVVKKDLTDEEEQLEKLCDEERYLELNTDIAEKTVYEEEEWKRYYEALQTGYNAVGFSYEQPRHEDDIYHQDVHQPEEEKPFIPPHGLNVPIHLELPATVKINAVIEKTAKFIAEHGAQMEIVLKAKQAGNSQFDFLDYNGPLNGYYKFMVSIIKSGKYVPKSDAAEIQRQESHEGYDHHEHGYLHKSLDTTKVEPVKSVKLPVVSIHDTPYGQLIKSIKKHHRDESESTNSSLQPPPLPPYTQQPDDDRQDGGHEDVQSYGHDGNRQSPAPPGTEPVDLPRQHVYSDNMPQLKSEEVNPIIPPPPDIQPIIDRMAMYVAKNGSEFEMVVKSKNDARFQFLNDWHVHFPYYDFRKNLHQKEILKEKKQKEEATAALLSKGVSFSIKTRTKEPESVAPLKKPLFDYGSSDDNDDESDSQKETSVPSSPRTDRTDNSNNNKLEVNTDSNTGYMSSDPLDEVDDKKIAEDRLMNRLASAAREKLAQTSKEKQIQAERKRKAAMFISLLKGKNGSGPDENEKKAPVVFDYGHKSLGSKSQSPSSDNRGVSPPKSFSKVRRSRSRSRSPVRKNSYYSSSSSRKSRSPYVSRQRSPRISPKRRSRTPRISPKRSRSPKHKSPRISPRRSKSPSKSRSEHRSSRSKSRSDDRSSRSRYTSKRHSRSKEKTVSEKSKIEIPPSETIESLKLMIKQEKLDPIFDKASNTNISLIDNSISNTDQPSDKSEHISNVVTGQTEKSTDSENRKFKSNDMLGDVAEEKKKLSETDNDPQTTDNIPPPIEKPEPPPEESDDDIAIIEPPPKILPEPELVVDLTVVIDSDSDNEKKSSRKSKNSKKRKSRSRSPLAKKKSRRSRSPTYSRPRRRSPSPLPPRRRRSRSKTPKRRSRSRSIAKKSRHATYKTSKKHRSRSRTPTKHRKQRSPSPKRKSRSRSPVKKTSRYKSKSRSPRSKRSRTPKVKKSKKNKSPSRSPKLHKKKKNKDKDRERERGEGSKSKEKTSAFKSLAEVVESQCKKDKLEERIETREETDNIDNTKYSMESNETSQDVPYELTSSPAPPTNLLNKVRAMLKASRDAMKDDEDVR